MSKVIETVNVSEAQIIDILTKIDRAVPVTFVARTPVKMNKSVVIEDIKVANKYHDKVFKTQEKNVFIGMDYAKTVNKRLVKENKEADFESAGCSYATKVGDSPIFVNNKDNSVFYVQIFDVTNNKAKSTYDVVSENAVSPITWAEIEAYMPNRSESSNNQNLENEVKVQFFKVSNLFEVRAGGKRYVINR